MQEKKQKKPKHKSTLTHTLQFIQKNNPKWIIDLSVKPKTMKFLGENMGENICDLGLCKEFLELTLW